MAFGLDLHNPSKTLTESYAYELLAGEKVKRHYVKSHRVSAPVFVQYHWDGLGRLNGLTLPGERKPSLSFTYTWGDRTQPSRISKYQKGVRKPTVTLLDSLQRNKGTVVPSEQSWLLSDFKVFGLGGAQLISSAPQPVAAIESALDIIDQTRLIKTQYDHQNRPIQILHQDGGTQLFRYSAWHRTHTNQMGEPVREIFDSFGRICEAQDVNSKAIPAEWAYMPTDCEPGTLSSKASHSGTSRHMVEYNVANQILRVISQGQPARSYHYDSRGRTKEINATGLGVIRFNYDPRGQLLRRETFSSSGKLLEALHSEWDGIGRELVRTGAVADGDGKLGPIDLLFRFAYDEVDVSYGIGQLTTLTYGGGESYRYHYTPQGLVDHEVFSATGRTLTTGYSYDSLGRLTAVVYPDHTRLGYSHSPETGATVGIDGTLFAMLGYNSFNQLHHLSMKARADGPAFSQTFTFDDKNRLKSHSGDFGGRGIFEQRTDGYDHLDRIVQSSGFNLFQKSFLKNFDYDLRGQLVRYVFNSEAVDGAAQSLTDDFSYYDNGMMSKLGAADVSLLLHPNDGLAGVSHGDKTWEFGDFGRLTRGPHQKSVNWNALGIIEKVLAPDGSSTSFGYKPDRSRLYEEYLSSDKLQKTYYVNDYVRFNIGSQTIEKYYKADGQNLAQDDGSLRFVVSDHLKSQTMLITAESGEVGYFAELKPFGAIHREEHGANRPHELFATGINNRQFGLDQMQNRFYASDLGMFGWVFVPKAILPAMEWTVA